VVGEFGKYPEFFSLIPLSMRGDERGLLPQCGLLILAFFMSHTIWLSEVLLLFTGASLMMVFSTVTSLVQLIAPNEMRGRVMSIYMVAFRGGMPLGSLAGGYFATIIGVPQVIGINGSLLVLVALYFPLVRSHGIRESG
jgi:predicted MFS family arabinose efflux permease